MEKGNTRLSKIIKKRGFAFEREKGRDPRVNFDVEKGEVDRSQKEEYNIEAL